MSRARQPGPLSMLGYTPPQTSAATIGAALRLIGRWREWQSRDLAGEATLTRVALSAPPLSRIARRMGNFADLLAARPSRPLLWWPRDRENVSRHDGALAELSHLHGHPLPPWTVDGGAYDAFRNPYLRMADVALFPRCGVVMPRPGLISAESHQQWRSVHRDLPGLVGFGGQAPRLHLEQARPRSTIAGPHLSICHPHVGNYAHWISDCLAGLVDVLDAVSERRVRLIAPPLVDWQRRSLALLGVPREAVTETTEPAVLCGELVWSGGSTTLNTHQPGRTIW